ncbi:putative methyltransferase PMT21 [Asimina triloba]
MKNRDLKHASQPDKISRVVPLTLMLLVLCGLSFYLGGIFCSEKNRILVKDLNQAVPSLKDSTSVSLQVKPVRFPECNSKLQDYTPCTDPAVCSIPVSIFDSLQFIFFWEPVLKRLHIAKFSMQNCVYLFLHHEKSDIQKSNQNWLRKNGEKFIFPGGGTMFPRGVGEYVNLMQELIPGMKDGTIRTALDTGCGVASWGGDLLDRGILTVSLAPRDNHEAQVQFALERGIPAILGIISTQRLPFPSNSFDMAHCSRCLIPWTEFGGVYLMEIHRVLRPGGFWVLSGPPINYENRWRGWNTTVEEQKSVYDNLKKLLTSMCFKLYNQKDDFAVWQKSPDNNCYNQRNSSVAYPPKCDDGTAPDDAWYVPLRPCLVVPSWSFKDIELKSTPKWPQRLHVAPQRIGMVPGASASAFKHDDSRWQVRVQHYKNLLPELGTDKIRNVMDMNTEYGGFAAALIDDPVWVMNVVSSYSINTLGAVYDRGLIGTYQDWCEAFSTYPRTYDLLHLDGLFTDESHRCDMKYVLLEMDRILRPEGYVIMRESNYFLNALSTIGKGMRWHCQKHDTEYSIEKEKLLICQKELWTPSKKD